MTIQDYDTGDVLADSKAGCGGSLCSSGSFTYTPLTSGQYLIGPGSFSSRQLHVHRRLGGDPASRRGEPYALQAGGLVRQDRRQHGDGESHGRRIDFSLRLGLR